MVPPSNNNSWHPSVLESKKKPLLWFYLRIYSVGDDFNFELKPSSGFIFLNVREVGGHGFYSMNIVEEDKK